MCARILIIVRRQKIRRNQKNVIWRYFYMRNSYLKSLTQLFVIYHSNVQRTQINATERALILRSHHSAASGSAPL